MCLLWKSTDSVPDSVLAELFGQRLKPNLCRAVHRLIYAEAGGRWICEFDMSRVYRVSPRTAKATQRMVSKQNKNLICKQSLMGLGDIAQYYLA